MPTIIQLRNPDLSNWKPVAPSESLGTTVTASNPGITSQNVPTRSPFMKAPMPIQASTADAFVRQLYGGPNVPTFRVLPVK
jgi:hypothetical protein